MALLVEDSKETCQILRALGYDPVKIVRGSITPDGFTERMPDSPARVRKWEDPATWPVIAAALERDARSVSRPSVGKVAGRRFDAVDHPAHYTSDPSGVECITITRHRTFNVGNAIKYLWRAGLKSDAGRDAREKQIEDLRKAIWYLNDEIGLLEGAA